jgi:hypothetical protein
MMVEAQDWQWMEAILEVLYIASGLILLIIIGYVVGFDILRYSLDEQLIILALSLLGALQLLAIWLVKKGKSWSIVVMILLSSLALPVLVLSLPVLGPGYLSSLANVAPLLLVCILNIVLLGLLSQDSIVSILLHRLQTLENDGPVLVNAVLHPSLGVLLCVLYLYGIVPKMWAITLLGNNLMNAIREIGILFLLIVVLLIVRWRFSWVPLLVLDVLLLIFSFVSLVFAFQMPDQLIAPTLYYRNWILRSIEDIGFVGFTFGIVSLLALVYSIPAVDTGKTLISLNKEHHEEGLALSFLSQKKNSAL